MLQQRKLSDGPSFASCDVKNAADTCRLAVRDEFTSIGPRHGIFQCCPVVLQRSWPVGARHFLAETRCCKRWRIAACQGHVWQPRVISCLRLACGLCFARRLRNVMPDFSLVPDVWTLNAILAICSAQWLMALTSLHEMAEIILKPDTVSHFGCTRGHALRVLAMFYLKLCHVAHEDGRVSTYGILGKASNCIETKHVPVRLHCGNCSLREL